MRLFRHLCFLAFLQVINDNGRNYLWLSSTLLPIYLK